jgi:hypothetical protein
MYIDWQYINPEWKYNKSDWKYNKSYCKYNKSDWKYNRPGWKYNKSDNQIVNSRWFEISDIWKDPIYFNTHVNYNCFKLNKSYMWNHFWGMKNIKHQRKKDIKSVYLGVFDWLIVECVDRSEAINHWII